MRSFNQKDIKNDIQKSLFKGHKMFFKKTTKVPERNDEAIDTLNFLLLASFILSKEFLKRGWRLYYCYKKKISREYP